MDLLNQFEYEQWLLDQLKELFECVPPAVLRRNIEDLFFYLLTSNEEYHISKEVAHHIYLLINFLNEVEPLRGND